VRSNRPYIYRRKEDAMNFEPTLFDNTMLETANEALLFCKDYLEKRELNVATQLEGLDPICTRTMASLALRVLFNIRTSVRGEAKECVDIAINAMKRAIRDPEYAAVA
jgi:hypothetical protein